MSAWLFVRARLQQQETQLKEEVQTILNLQHQAYLDGDGELFFSFFPPDPAWRMVQLWPQNQVVYRTGAQVTRAELHEDTIWANIAWVVTGQTWQRIAFFQRQNGQLRQVPDAPMYWGEPRSTRQSWGSFEFYETDAAWAVSIVTFVDGVVAELCPAGCQNLPFTLSIEPGFGQTADSTHIMIPSPRLLALDETGEPAPPFWQQLHQQLQDRLTPGTIRFAVPNAATQPVDYQRAAAQFITLYPGMKVEIVPVEAITLDLLATVDGAAIPATADLIAAGAVMDLTDFVQTDATFFQEDFPSPVWHGTGWQNRVWFVPQAARMPLIFYDRTAFQQVALPQPNFFITWEEMERDVALVLGAKTADSPLEWGFLDVTLATLFAQATRWETTIHTSRDPLNTPLSLEGLEAAFSWYQKAAGTRLHYLPDLTTLPPAERELVMTRWQSASRRAIFWVDEPGNYEYQLLLAAIGVTPFPQSSITPLELEGSLMSQSSQRPFSTWLWLKFLSTYPPAPGYRYIPARYTTIEVTDYWERLPEPLRLPMQAAFKTARPIWIEEQPYFSWELLTAVMEDQRAIQQILQQAGRVNWFAAR